jgi:hypothetical protein
MARIAHDVMVEAERAFRRADALSAGMEPHLLKRVNQSAIYGYTNDRDDRNVPPGDVLLAAALAAGISLDRKLGLAPDTPNAMTADVPAQLAEMRDEIAQLRAEVTGLKGAPPSPVPDDRDLAAVKAERAAQRRAWAERSHADVAAGEPARTTRGGGRSAGR